MQDVTVSVLDSKIGFFHELMQSLCFNEVSKPIGRNSVLTDHQIELVEIELQKIKEDPNYMLDWEEARKTLKFR